MRPAKQQPTSQLADVASREKKGRGGTDGGGSCARYGRPAADTYAACCWSSGPACCSPWGGPAAARGGRPPAKKVWPADTAAQPDEKGTPRPRLAAGVAARQRGGAGGAVRGLHLACRSWIAGGSAVGRSAQRAAPGCSGRLWAHPSPGPKCWCRQCALRWPLRPSRPRQPPVLRPAGFGRVPAEPGWPDTSRHCDSVHGPRMPGRQGVSRPSSLQHAVCCACAGAPLPSLPRAGAAQWAAGCLACWLPTCPAAWGHCEGGLCVVQQARAAATAAVSPVKRLVAATGLRAAGDTAGWARRSAACGTCPRPCHPPSCLQPTAVPALHAPERHALRASRRGAVRLLRRLLLLLRLLCLLRAPRRLPCHGPCRAEALLAHGRLARPVWAPVLSQSPCPGFPRSRAAGLHAGRQLVCCAQGCPCLSDRCLCLSDKSETPQAWAPALSQSPCRGCPRSRAAGLHAGRQLVCCAQGVPASQTDASASQTSQRLPRPGPPLCARALAGAALGAAPLACMRASCGLSLLESGAPASQC